LSMLLGNEFENNIFTLHVHAQSRTMRVIRILAVYANAFSRSRYLCYNTIGT
jgi:hypothetical protein